MRLGDEAIGAAPKKGKGKGKKAEEEDDDGGWETTAHFMDDVFGEWLDEADGKEMSFRDLMDWSEVRRCLLRVVLTVPRRAPCRPCSLRAALVPPHARGLTYEIVALLAESSRGGDERVGASGDLRPHAGCRGIVWHLDELDHQMVGAGHRQSRQRRMRLSPRDPFAGHFRIRQGLAAETLGPNRVTPSYTTAFSAHQRGL